MVRDIKDLPRKINEAFLIATSGRPGPVLVDLPKDVRICIFNLLLLLFSPLFHSPYMLTHN